MGEGPGERVEDDHQATDVTGIVHPDRSAVRTAGWATATSTTGCSVPSQHRPRSRHRRGGVPPGWTAAAPCVCQPPGTRSDRRSCGNWPTSATATTSGPGSGSRAGHQQSRSSGIWTGRWHRHPVMTWPGDDPTASPLVATTARPAAGPTRPDNGDYPSNEDAGRTRPVARRSHRRTLRAVLKRNLRPAQVGREATRPGPFGGPAHEAPGHRLHAAWRGPGWTRLPG